MTASSASRRSLGGAMLEPLRLRPLRCVGEHRAAVSRSTGLDWVKAAVRVSRGGGEALDAGRDAEKKCDRRAWAFAKARGASKATSSTKQIAVPAQDPLRGSCKPKSSGPHAGRGCKRSPCLLVVGHTHGGRPSLTTPVRLAWQARAVLQSASRCDAFVDRGCGSWADDDEGFSFPPTERVSPPRLWRESLAGLQLRTAW